MVLTRISVAFYDVICSSIFLRVSEDSLQSVLCVVSLIFVDVIRSGDRFSRVSHLRFDPPRRRLYFVFGIHVRIFVLTGFMQVCAIDLCSGGVCFCIFGFTPFILCDFAFGRWLFFLDDCSHDFEAVGSSRTLSFVLLKDADVAGSINILRSRSSFRRWSTYAAER